MLTNVALRNFKCFQNLNLECAPLNLLCGLNGMGKSSIIQALLVLRQSFETGELINGRLGCVDISFQPYESADKV